MTFRAIAPAGAVATAAPSSPGREASAGGGG